MHKALVRFFKNLRILLRHFQNTLNRDLIKSTEMLEAVEMELIYILLSFRMLIDDLIKEFDEAFDFSMYIKTIIYICFNVLLVLIFLFI